MKKKPTKRKAPTSKAQAGDNLRAFTECTTALHGYSKNTQIVALAATAQLLGIHVTIGK